MKTAIITGGYGAIGLAIANGLAVNRQTKVIILGRDPAKLQEAVENIRFATGNQHVSGEMIDLASAFQIRSFANNFDEPADILINNAATAPRQRIETPEGIEMQWAVNVLAYHRLIKALLPNMKRAENARVVNVASYWAGGLVLSDPEFRKRRYDNDSAYRQSKQANRMMSAYWAEVLNPFGITVNCCHPGDVNSKLSNSLGFGGSESPEKGADTPVWLATSAEVKGITGCYFEHRRKQYCDFMSDRQRVLDLITLLDQYD